jgi:hypothetical protein
MHVDAAETRGGRMVEARCKLRALGVLLAAVVMNAGPAAAQVTCPGTWPPVTLTNGTTTSASDVMSNFTYLYNCLTAITLGSSEPQGRLTLAPGIPVMTGNQTGETVIYYTPYVGNAIAITTNGTSFTSTAFAELSNLTTASASGYAGPAVVAANSNYDLFVWSNGGTLVLTRGPAWMTDSNRGIGAGTSELQRVAGLWTNKNAITNGPGANLGTYVGTVRSNGSAQIDWTPSPAAASGGGNAVLGVFNAYNRRRVAAVSVESTGTWTYGTATWRAANGSAANRVSWIDGLQESTVSARYQLMSNNRGGSNGIGVNFNATAGQPALSSWLSGNNSTNAWVLLIETGTQPLLGFNYAQAMEKGDGSAAADWYGRAFMPEQQLAAMALDLEM